MLLPTKIIHPYERVPYVTYALLGLNTVLFFITPGTETRSLRSVMLHPTEFAVHQLFTHAFLHGDFFHLAGNMLFLAVYGRYVEERLGPWRYAGAYLLFGLSGAFAYLAANHGNPCLGSSGAISGLLGFVLVGAPYVDVRVLFVFYVYGRAFKIAAVWLIGLWLLMQLAMLRYQMFIGVAISAHLGGFFAGAALATLLRHDVCKGTDWYLDPSLPRGGEAASKRLRHARRIKRTHDRPATPVHEVELLSIAADASPVAIVKMFMRRLDRTPQAAKAEVDALRDGQPLRIAFADAATADAFAEEAYALGVRTAHPGPS